MAKVETLTDLFNSTLINTVPWFVTQNGSAVVTESSSGANCAYPASSTSSTDGDIFSNSTYDLTNSYAYLHVITVPSSGTNADALMEITSSGGTGNMARWVYEGGTLYAQWAVGFAFNTVFSVAYSSTTHAWWRIREGTGAGAGGTAGTIYWDTAPDASGQPGTWVNRGSVATSSITGGITTLGVLIGGVCFEAETSPGNFKWNNLNTFPGAGGGVNKGAALLGIMGM